MKTIPRVVYLVSTEDLEFLEEVNKSIEMQDHEVPLITSPHIPLRELYRYIAGAKIIEKVGFTEEFDFPV